MARVARSKPKGRAQNYHVYNRVAGVANDFPLQRHHARQLFLEILTKYSQVYFCALAAFAILGNHFHTVLRFLAFTQLSRDELRERAERLYEGRFYKPYLFWREKQWRRFNERLFDVSELMRNVEADFAVHFNKICGRRGRLWGDRFKSSLLESPEALRAAVLYVEMNGVRAGLASRPEDYRYGSARLRLLPKQTTCPLMPLTELWGVKDPVLAIRTHFAYLYHRGGVRIENVDELISEIIGQDSADGYQSGTYRTHHRCFVDGGVIGSTEEVRPWQEMLCETGVYRKAREPVPAG